jgi:predicted 2-oxoglutarate/Fe(II)-dependent dioxygenase YbiX
MMVMEMMTFLNKQQVMMMKKEGQEIDWESVDGHFEVNLVLFMWKVTENLNETSSLETSLQAAIKRIELKKVKY